MSMPEPVWLQLLPALLLGVLAIATILGLVIWIGRRSRTVADDPGLWDGRDYRCPRCGDALSQGWVLLGKGAIWSDRAAGRPGTLAHIGNALPNTISMRLRPAANMAWRCERCRILTLDYDKLVG